MTKNTDPLDLAYVAIGAAFAWDTCNGPGTWKGEGHLDYIGRCTAPAVLDYLQETYDTVKEVYGGVWVYDVCQPFGEQYGAAILTNEEADFQAFIDDLVKDLL